MTDLEDRFVAECRRQGVQPDQHAMQKAAVDLCNASLTPEGLIRLPIGTISPADFVRSLHSQTPESFAALDDKPPAIKPSGNLTADMKAEIAATRRKQSVPDDWHSVRSRYSADSVTGRMMDEVQRQRTAQSK
jgi:hypothetical protein